MVPGSVPVSRTSIVLRHISRSYPLIFLVLHQPFWHKFVFRYAYNESVWLQLIVLSLYKCSVKDTTSLSLFKTLLSNLTYDDYLFQLKLITHEGFIIVCRTSYTCKLGTRMLFFISPVFTVNLGKVLFNADY